MQNDFALYNGVKIPPVGMGTWPLRGDNLEYLMAQAIDLGYRMFDTADNYFNEEFVGNVVSKIKREDLFIVTKLSDEKKIGFPFSSIGKYFYKNSSYMKEHTAKETVNVIFENSLKKLKTDYVDLLIMHWPYPDYFLEIWSAMENLVKDGKVRAIGISNCRERHFELLKKNGLSKPMVHQVSISPLDTKKELFNYCNSNDICQICYAPLMCARNSKFAESSIAKQLANKYGVGLSGLILLWNKSQGLIPIPKSTKTERLKENFDIVMNDFKMDAADIEALSSLNINMQYLPESCYCPGL